MLINGSWGSGKTFFFKNSLVPICVKHKKKTRWRERHARAYL
ncbi:hypothetical protein [Flavobacterium sp. N1718]